MVVTEYNALTGETVQREPTEQEINQHAIDQSNFESAAQQAIDDAAAKQAAKESGEAKLISLGLTVDEVEAMTNG